MKLIEKELRKLIREEMKLSPPKVGDKVSIRIPSIDKRSGRVVRSIANVTIIEKIGPDRYLGIPAGHSLEDESEISFDESDIISY
jgi:hypothetical protein